MFIAFGLAGLLTKLDGFGEQVKLKLNGKDEKKTLIGAFISLAMYALVLYLSFDTLLDYINQTNPNIVTSIDYGTQNLTIDYKNFFFGLSFYYPSKNSRSISAATNDLKQIKFFNELNIHCTTCEGDYMNPKALMNLCNKDQYNNITLKSMSEIKSDGISSIFTDHSFCFPTDFKSVIKDNDSKNSDQESSLQLYIPISKNNVNGNLKTNAFPQPGNESFNATEGTSKASKRKKNQQKSVENKVPPPSTENGNTSSSINQGIGPKRNLAQSPSVSPKIIFSPFQNQVKASTDPSQELKIGKIGSSPRFKNSINKRIDYDLRNLQTSNSNFNAGALDAFKNQMELVFDSFKFPKMLLMHRGVEVNSRSDPHINFVYHFDTLDYLDPITGNPNVYDIYLEKNQIFIEHGTFLFSSEPQIIEFIRISKIEKNNLDSLDSDGAYISFKFISDTKQIHLIYTGFGDFLGVYGSFYAIFVLVAILLSRIYREAFFNQNLITSVFKFVQTTPEEKHDFRNFIFNERNKLLQVKKNSNEQKNITENNEILGLKENETYKNKSNLILLLLN